jgi:hypothetical protein
MNRFARMLVIATMAFVLSAALTSVSAADTGKRGSTVTVQQRGQLATGHMRPVLQTDAQGGYYYSFFGQYFDWYRFWYALWMNYKYYD